MDKHERLARQIAFIVEIDQMQKIYRQNYVIDGAGRRETDAEHSWHLAVMALLHDLVEIDAGDTYCYD